MLAKKLIIIEGAKINKEKNDNNFIYVKMTRSQAYRWLNYSFFSNKFEVYDNGKEIVLSLTLPELKSKKLYNELVKEPVWNTVIDLLINVANTFYQGKLDAPKYVKALHLLKEKDVPDYEQTILDQDDKINELETIIKQLKDKYE